MESFDSGRKSVRIAVNVGPADGHWNARELEANCALFIIHQAVPELQMAAVAKCHTRNPEPGLWSEWVNLEHFCWGTLLPRRRCFGNCTELGRV